MVLFIGSEGCSFKDPHGSHKTRETAMSANFLSEATVNLRLPPDPGRNWKKVIYIYLTRLYGLPDETSSEVIFRIILARFLGLPQEEATKLKRHAIAGIMLNLDIDRKDTPLFLLDAPDMLIGIGIDANEASADRECKKALLEVGHYAREWLNVAFE